MRTTGDACLLAAAALLLLGLAQGLDPIFDSIDVEGEILQGGTELVSASGDLRDGIVHRAELETATGEACGRASFNAAINAYSFFPALTGMVPDSAVEWVVATDADSPLLAVDRTFTAETVGSFPAGLDPRGMAISGAGTLYIVDTTNLWSADPTDPANAASGADFPAGLQVATGSPRGAAISATGTLYVADEIADELWSMDPADPGAATVVGSFPSGLTDPRGMAISGSTLYVLDDGADELWSMDPSNPSGATNLGAFPTGLGAPGGVVVSASTIYVSATDGLYSFGIGASPSAAGRFQRISLTTPEIVLIDGLLYWTTARQLQRPAGDPSCIAWRYVTASDNPRAYAATDAEGRIVSWWASEDPAADPVLANVTGWTGATYTPMQVSMPPDAVLTGLYAGRDSALDGLRGELSSRGWSAAGADVAALVANVPATGCGTVNGDCQPMARLLALRALAAARGETVFGIVSRETRIAADGTWSLAP